MRSEKWEYPVFPLPTSHFPLPTSHFSLPTSHFSLPTSHFVVCNTQKVLI
ncbi:MAG: hypothetical protein GY749_12875 [Desulfobacteraceae bacterium]|nr:hypothetical protein [Desulfobacteraceae bacterium]